jgi:hypothetical protein
MNISGYHGIWFELGQKTEFGDKYSGGLGTYTANHNPMAIYAEEVNKTFFTYGGTIEGERHLLVMVGVFDHEKGLVSRPVIVHDKQDVDDPHDNGSINIDSEGSIWIFVSGRGVIRPGYKYRSLKPFDISAFQLIATQEITYPQPWLLENKSWIHLFTKYKFNPGTQRELFFESSADGVTWSKEQKLAGFGGHYQVSNYGYGKIATFFNYHPDGDCDRRTNLYYVQSTDNGKTWSSVTGESLSLPLSEVDNAALVIDYEAQGTLMYTCDLNFDSRGNPILLYVTSRHKDPGPKGDPREFVITHFDGNKWNTHSVTPTDHNYDMGSLFVEGEVWKIIAPTGAGPQAGHTGGEMVLWISRNAGQSWELEQQITDHSTLNHAYARRPLNASDPFYTFWADGDPTAFSSSSLFFCDSSGKQVFQLPRNIEGSWGEAVKLEAIGQ